MSSIHKLEELFRETLAIYEQTGLCGRVGMGKRCAIVVVDLIKAFTNPDKTIGTDLTSVVMANQTLLRAARSKQIPVVFTVMGYRSDLSDAGAWPCKHKSLKDLDVTTDAGKLDPRLEPRESDYVIQKYFPSAFFGTNLSTLLRTLEVDTVIVTGTTTSCCVRATAVDALSNGLRVIIPRECVGDRAELPHLWNLFDIDAKFGDVMSLHEVINSLQSGSGNANELKTFVHHD